MRGYWKEARQWLNKTLGLGTSTGTALRANSIYKAGGLELIRGNLAETEELVEEALAICREANDDEGSAWCLNLLGQAKGWHGETINEAVTFLSESVELFNNIKKNWGVAWGLRYLGLLAEDQGDYARSLKLQKEALGIFERIGDIWNTAQSLYLLGRSAFRYEDNSLCQWSFEESLAKCALVEDRVVKAHAFRGLAELALQCDDLSQV